LAGLGWWLAGGWLVVGWWLVGGWLVVGWWLAGGWLVVGWWLAGGWLGWLAGGWLVGWAGLGWWLAGGWLVVGWWLVGWWLAGTRHRNATLGECSFAAGCWLLVAGCWLLVAWRRKVARNATILLRAGSVYKTTFRPTTRLLVVRKKAYTKHLFDTFLKNIFGVNTL
jgi:hypothetical protein